ncbi:uncharacterized protein C12orf56 homolog [Denticeps clupeoides]|uniref:uncharacterized protein C12orf56 homolog n=1 Tax=Denticeps clupeoides TaxID=299321 RepID=UPI0010A34483|nr:uncharacterized protein C12orf56 homolog [Denticeps clupeoides]
MRTPCKLDSFLKRTARRDVYERIRACEPCVVVSDAFSRVFMHVVLSDDGVYLAEYPPRSLRQAARFRDVTAIELINDLPDFLSGRERERSQHIRVIYTATKHAGKQGSRLRAKSHPTNGHSLREPCSISTSVEGISSVLLSTHALSSESRSWRISPSSERQEGIRDEDAVQAFTKPRSASYSNAEALGLRFLSWRLPSPNLYPPVSTSSSSRSSPLPSCITTPGQKSQPGGVTAPSRRGSVLVRLLKRAAVEADREEEPAAELHLYAVSPASRIYLHLQSCWNSYIIKSTLMLDPLYVRRCNTSSPSSRKQQHHLSWERTSYLFMQLSGELLQKEISMESVYLLLQELHTAAHRSATIRKLFWRSSDLCPFLVKTLEDALQDTDSQVHTADRLLLCTLTTRTLALMFREMDTEPARLDMMSAKQGDLTVKLLQALVCNPEIHLPTQKSGSPESERKNSSHMEIQVLQAEYLDAACALLFEVVVLCQEASRVPSLEKCLTVGWVLMTLKTHPFVLPFVGYQAQQVVLVLSASQHPLTPSQAVLLYQRCRVLLACLQYSTHLSSYLRSEFREEFRYYIKLAKLEDKLLPHYPISKPAQHLLSQLLTLVLHRP